MLNVNSVILVRSMENACADRGSKETGGVTVDRPTSAATFSTIALQELLNASTTSTPEDTDVNADR